MTEKSQPELQAGISRVRQESPESGKTKIQNNRGQALYHQTRGQKLKYKQTKQQMSYVYHSVDKIWKRSQPELQAGSGRIRQESAESDRTKWHKNRASKRPPT